MLSAASRYGQFLFQMGGGCAHLCCPHMGRFCWLSPTLCKHGDGEQMSCFYHADVPTFGTVGFVGTLFALLVEIVALLWNNSRDDFLAF